MPSPVKTYLDDLRRALRGNPLLARRVLREVSDHLAEAVVEGRRSSMSQEEAEKSAVSRFGPAGEFARRFDRFSLAFKLLLGVASGATAAVALWLLWVVAFVLPARDPTRIPMWLAVALCFMGYSALCWTYLRVGPSNKSLRWSVLTLSAFAMGLGVYGPAAMLWRTTAGGHFEGYIVLMGAILFGHGLTGAINDLLTAQIARRVRTP